MQPIVPPVEHNPNQHTQEEILSALRGKTGIRRLSFRYDLLNSASQLIQPLSTVLSGQVEQNWLADIKRKATMRIRDTGEIDYLSDRIQPWVRLGLPPYGPSDWVEWAQGVFILSTPARADEPTGGVFRDVEGYDLLLIYAGDLVADRYSIVAGTAYTTAISTLLGSVDKVLTPSTLTLPTTKEWEPGTSKLHMINELLTAINYQSLSFDESGAAVVIPYLSPQDRPSEYPYADDQDGVTLPGYEQTLDLFNVPNRWVLVVSDPDRPPLMAEYVNNDPASPTSTVRRQRVITDFRTEEDAATQAVLQDKVERLAFESSQIYEAIEFDTALMPIHSGNDVYSIVYDPLAINAKYSEHTWTLPLRPGGVMQHRARRMVSL